MVFRNVAARDGALERIWTAIKTSRLIPLSVSSEPLTPSGSSGPSMVSGKHNATNIFAPLSRSLAAAVALGLPTAVQLTMPKAINLPREILAGLPPMHFVCLTIGSRGDVQPYIALGLGLKKEGHRVTIVTHEEYKDWIVGFGIAHRTAGGDPGALMKLSVDHKASIYFLDYLPRHKRSLDVLPRFF